MKDLKRHDLVEKIDLLTVTYCEGCFLYKHLKQESGRRQAHRFCISQCTVGQKIQECGNNLN
jgi:hypothetical protein